MLGVPSVAVRPRALWYRASRHPCDIACKRAKSAHNAGIMPLDSYMPFCRAVARTPGATPPRVTGPHPVGVGWERVLVGVLLPGPTRDWQLIAPMDGRLALLVRAARRHPCVVP